MKMPANVLEKRNMIYGNNLAEKDLIKIVENFLQDNKVNDAIDFCKKIDNEELFTKIKGLVIDAGEYFLAKKLNVISPLEQKDWGQLAENAVKQEKIFFAKDAYGEANMEEQKNELLERIKSKYQGKYFERL